MGETTLDGTRTVSRQPYAGVLFKSQNGSTYTADQNEDLKFTVKKAVFETIILQLLHLQTIVLIQEH